MKKQAGFDRVKEAQAATEVAEDAVKLPKDIGGRRGNEESLTSIRVRFRYAQWQAVHALALSLNTSVQGLIIYALDRLFKERGRLFADLPVEAKPEDVFNGSSEHKIN